MARNKNQNWNLPDGNPSEGGGRTHQWESIHTALLMDIRDELQQLNRVFACPNFQAMPHEMRKLRIAGERLDRRIAK
ncbi:MAG: hypothetical protein FD161_3018 [Limisphaerales bacterium]|nr:MAG: hypothetical protein FD161_3018 [Limisphaerales bacterium]KAG0508131.1 MAG: hypothetical protein E1N63_2725 [Limisphaerales bacterium]TXT53016.1 MAG: hypothetical protein FD140_124 [Limisphaerales bacterium]